MAIDPVQERERLMDVYSHMTDGELQGLAEDMASLTAVATINLTGMVASLSSGATTISATSGSATGSTVLTVGPAVPMSLAISPLNPTAYVGSPQQFTATLTYSDGTSQDATSSARPSWW